VIFYKQERSCPLRKIFIAPLILISVVSCRNAASEQDKLAGYIHARGFCIIDAQTGKTIAQKNSSKPVPVASTTKMISALTARCLVKGNPIVKITKESALLKGSQAGLKEGERYYFNDLLTAMLVKSANDAATAVAVFSAGSKGSFVSEMNKWCAAHNLVNSKFADPAGLSSESVSSPDDLVIIAREFLSVKEFNDIASLNSYTLKSLEGRSIPMKSLNILHRVMPEEELSVKGKTGFTSRAKYCFAGKIMTKKGKWFIAVTGADNAWRELYMLTKYCDGELELPE